MGNEVTCKYCGKTTPARYGNGLARHYCGKECSELHRNKLRRERRAAARPSHEDTLAGFERYMAARRKRLADDKKVPRGPRRTLR